MIGSLPSLCMSNNCRDVKNLLNESKIALEKACMGSAPDNRAELPAFLTAELTLRLLERVMRESLTKIRDLFIELKNQGVALSYNNPQLLMGLHGLKLDDIKYPKKKFSYSEGKKY